MTCTAAGLPNNLCPVFAQVYATSIMFGYFVRRVDKRFQLERSLGLLSESETADAVQRLERLFAQVLLVQGSAFPIHIPVPSCLMSCCNLCIVFTLHLPVLNNHACAMCL